MTLPPLTQSALELHLPHDIAMLAHQYIIPADLTITSIIYMGHGELWSAHIDPRCNLWYACTGGHIDLVKTFLPASIYVLNDSFEQACLCGHIDIARLLISHGASTFNNGLVDACCRGNRELVDLMISHGADQWNRGLSEACMQKNRELVNLMISHGASECNHCGTWGIIYPKLGLWHRQFV